MHDEFKVRWGLRMTKSIRRCSLTHEGGSKAQSTSSSRLSDPPDQQPFSALMAASPWRSFKALDRGDPCEW